MRGDSREYTAHGAKTFTLMKHKSIRHMHEWRYRDYYNVVGNCDDFQVYRFKKMHEGVGGCEGPGII